MLKKRATSVTKKPAALEFIRKTVFDEASKVMQEKINRIYDALFP
jgi:hypothetical protein